MKSLQNIGTLVFSTKKKCEEYTRNLITKLDCCIIDRSHTYFQFFCDLISKRDHYEFHMKTNIPITHFQIAPNPLNANGFQTSVFFSDQSSYVFSWVKCARGAIENSNNQNLTIAFREAISNDIIKFKQSSNLICKLCKDTTQDPFHYHVDHNAIPFRQLRDDFLNHNQLLLPQSFGKNDNCITSFTNENDQFRNDWVTYHNAHCDLQILCATCNIKKG
jgi:hypothetical protein